jgi:hypothetical protein
LISRRTFVAVSGAFAALLRPFSRAAAAPATSEVQDLPLAQLTALAGAVLPTQLGADGTERAARNFATWIGGYTAGAEVLHPYGDDTIESLGPSPAPEWRAQLNDLDTRARATGGRLFASLRLDERQAIVREAIGTPEGNGLPAPLRARHVALALMSHYFNSADADDLCYEVQIRREQCRPLRNAARAPLPIAARRQS